MGKITEFLIALGIIVFVVFFSVQLQKICLKIFTYVMTKIGLKTKNAERIVRRKVFTKPKSFRARLYNWTNEQIICLGLKKVGVTPVGFITFWLIVAMPITIGVGLYFKLGVIVTFLFYILLDIVFLFVTRIYTASRIEGRESYIMKSIDTIIPDIGNGVQNAIRKYIDVLPEQLQDEYRAFLDRIVKKGMSFDDSMMILADDIGGSVFQDFALKCIYFEKTGEVDTLDAFTVIVETNTVRRELRYTNKLAFDALRTDFLLASVVVWAYVLGVGLREQFTWSFTFENSIGKVLFIFDLAVEVMVLGFITSIRSKDL